MIVGPLNDRDCLGQVVAAAVSLVPSDDARHAAANIRSEAQRRGVAPLDFLVDWIRNKPQTDDDGAETIRIVQCDVGQRVRFLSDDPNCVERARDYLILAELIEPATRRTLETDEGPPRHTRVVELVPRMWGVGEAAREVVLFPRREAAREVVLFPRRKSPSSAAKRGGRNAMGLPRNVDWAQIGRSILHGTHDYVGKPLLKYFAGDTGVKVADFIGEQEHRLDPAKPSAPSPAAPKPVPPRPPQPQPQPRPPSPPHPRLQQPQQQLLTLQQVGGAAGSATTATSPPPPVAFMRRVNPTFEGGSDAETEKKTTTSQAPTTDGAPAAAAAAPKRRRLWW